MFKIFKDKNPEEMLIKKYKRYRNESKKLSEKIFEKYTDERNIKETTQLMGIRQGNTLILDEEEVTFLMDFLMYEHRVAGKNFVDKYKEENPQLEQLDSEIIEAKTVAYTSLFKVIDLNPSTATTLFQDLFQAQKEIKIMDINFSRTATPGALMFTRVLSFPDFNMTSGMFCVFPPGSERALLKKYNNKVKKVKSDIESVRRFITFFKLNRTEGLAARTSDY